MGVGVVFKDNLSDGNRLLKEEIKVRCVGGRGRGRAGGVGGGGREEWGGGMMQGG